MDEHAKDYLLDQAMISIASFSAAARMTRKKLKNLISQPGVGDMSTEEVLEYLVDFMEKESDKMFANYDDTSGFKKKVNKDTIYIELIPDAPFNPEDKEGSMEIIRDQCKDKKYSLIQVYDKNGLPNFVTVDEFEKDYYEYWEILMRLWNASEEDIQKFKQGSHDYRLHGNTE